MIAIGGGIGASVITSQYLGAGRFDRMKTSVYTALITFLGVGIFLGVFGFVMNRQILVWLNTPENILEAAGTYLGIYFLGMPFLFMYNVLSSMFNALGDSRTPLGLLIFSSVLNVVLDLWFRSFLRARRGRSGNRYRDGAGAGGHSFLSPADAQAEGL